MIKVTYADGTTKEYKDELDAMIALQDHTDHDWRTVSRQGWHDMLDGLREVMDAITPEDNFEYCHGYTTFVEDFALLKTWVEEHKV